jgi:hypothetical protein
MNIVSRLAERLIKEGKLLPIVAGEKKVGTRLSYIQYWNSSTRQGEGLLLEEYKGSFHREYYWEVQVYAPLRRVLECAFPSVDWNEFNEENKQLKLL